MPVSATSLQTAKLGYKAPDFIAQNMLKQESFRLAKLEGKSVLLVFYNPKSPLSTEILDFARTMQTNHGDSVTVLGMSVIDDSEIVKKQAEAAKINFAVLNGSGLRSSYGLESTPKIVLLDAKGIVRLNCLGWGQETQSEITSELKRTIDKD
jgi:peroxiredoxin